MARTTLAHDTPECADFIRKIGSIRDVQRAAGVKSTRTVRKWREGICKPSMEALQLIIDKLIPLDPDTARRERSHGLYHAYCNTGTVDNCTMGRRTEPVGISQYTREASAGLFASEAM